MDSEEEEPKCIFCLICNENSDHETINCPDKAQAYATLCRICDDGPCENEDDPDHKEQHYECLMNCENCGAVGKHWEDTCPFDSDNENGDFDYLY